MKALVRVKAVRRPTSQEFIGYRLQAAIPNEAQRKMIPKITGDGDVDGFIVKSDMVPSFQKPYLIQSSSDESYINEKVLRRFLDKLRWEGYHSFDFVGKYEGEWLANLFGHLG